MPDLSAIVSALRSAKLSLVIFAFSVGLLFAPFEAMGLKDPEFTKEYEAYFVIALFLSGAFLLVEVLFAAKRAVMRPLNARDRKKWVEETFYSLNLDELCLLWAMTENGMKTIKGSSSNTLMISLRQKRCLNHISGYQSMNQMHHVVPDDIYEIVRERGYGRMPDEFKNSVRFSDDVREIVAFATDPWT